MAQYTINYLDGEEETVKADKVNMDDEAKVFVFRTGPITNEPDAIIPQASVRSIHRQDDEAVTG